ncbi:hypothetical protein NE237_017924 [Protea cynaroides]|uniref:Uncharacterized protein n=1 Tax=Protea cynaroides TaxID=273540 RepID=A0A9Q0QNH8_9MAGN|nr:hypothetical protein NE237_017924 [Protea cynaroides]
MPLARSQRTTVAPSFPASLKATESTSRGLLKLRDDVRACKYEDVQVLWEMLKNREMELARLARTATKKQKRAISKNLKSILAVTEGIHEGSNEKSSFNAIAMICPFLLENVVETHAGGGVKCLTKYCGGDAGEESSDTFGLEDLDVNADGSHFMVEVEEQRRRQRRR